MGWIIPVRLRPVEVLVHADWRLAFQVLTAFGTPSSHGDAWSRVLEREGDSLLVEFHTPVRGPLGRTRTYTTVERVTLREPVAIEFKGVRGPMPLLRDRFVLEDLDGCTLFRYESVVGLGWWVLGWLLATTYVRRTLGRFMREHALHMKETIEARARRSRAFPQKSCAHGEGAR